MRTVLAALAAFSLLTPAASAEPPTLPGGHIDYTGMVLYEVNLRQYTPEGTINAFRENHLERLDKMGVDILWLMPVHPIGEQNRKGGLGSYYSVRDYTAVNPEFGTVEDLAALVEDAHDRDMLVILDWVPNHAAWDNAWATDHPDWFTRDENGSFVPPVADWHDVIDLNYDNPDMRRAMTDAMKFWIQETDIDGFRCDVAELVPPDYWSECIGELRETKPVFMLAEGHQPWLFDSGFDVCYGWGLADNMLKVVAGEADANDLWDFIESEQAERLGHGQDLPLGPQRMWFTTNHDWNSWVGVSAERFGPASESAALLTFAVPGIPMIYSGQEAGLDKQLSFFEKDQIDWRNDPASKYYTWMCESIAGDPRDLGFTRVEGVPDTVFAFERNVAHGRAVLAVNFSPEPVDIEINGWKTRLTPWGYGYQMLGQDPN